MNIIIVVVFIGCQVSSIAVDSCRYRGIRIPHTWTTPIKVCTLRSLWMSFTKLASDEEINSPNLESIIWIVLQSN